ncbi:MAG: hypothetical protein D6680_12915 [Cyanobacteria bacterium J007]|nr:MAG: hypothetical protein D6680_12915 [Cyanobacteria bacterium J007]
MDWQEEQMEERKLPGFEEVEVAPLPPSELKGSLELDSTNDRYLPVPVGEAGENLDSIADLSLRELIALVRYANFSDRERQPSRIYVGLTFVGMSAFLLTLLLLSIVTLHPEWGGVGGLRHYWYQYIAFVSFGVSGMMMLGREAMRPPFEAPECNPEENP